MKSDGKTIPRVSSGVQGIDSILAGGFVEGRLYLVIGSPGTGKTTLGVEFLRNGLDAGEKVLYVHGEEGREELLINANQYGIDLTDADFLDIGPTSDYFTQSQSYDVVNPQDIEEENLITRIRDTIDEHDPDRALIDPITQFQYLEATEYHFRKRIISFAR
ncbi:MAG: ATPase domain-containing protein, partial [Halobacteriota archaeon]